jgi:voltage-gated potassium channel
MPQKTVPVQQETRIGLVLIAITTAAVISGAAAFYHFVEQFSWIDAFYFAVLTVATVGYGDVVPQTDIGKLFTIGYVVIGIGLVATFVNVVVRGALARRIMHHDAASDNK